MCAQTNTVASDPRGVLFAETHTPIHDGYRIRKGIVQKVFPFIGQYEVACGRPVICTSTQIAGGFGFEVCAQGQYGVGDSVLCAVPENGVCGFILGSLPRKFYGRETRPFISGASDISELKPNSVSFALCGGPVSGCTKEDTISMQYDISTHLNPADGFGGGGFNVFTSGGAKLTVDPLSIAIAASDGAGSWYFCDDDFVRHAGVNFQEIAGGTVREHYMDGTECTEYEGHSLFTWEPLGLTRKPSEQGAIECSPEVLTREASSAWEPQENARPFHRVMEYGGYLGHGYQRYVVAPPSSTETLTYGKDSYSMDQECLSRFSQFVDGYVGIESVKGISLSKTCFIPHPQTLYPIDDLEGGCGDSEKGGYDFSHQEMKIESEPANSVEDSGTSELLQTVMALSDYNAYISNFKLVHAFCWHQKDYKVVEEYDTSLRAPDYSTWFSALKEQELAPLPESRELDIHENLKSKYFASESGFALLPEGSVCCYGGYGEELRMAAGSVTLSAPGDVWLKAGRNLHLWAGKDIILRANQNIDESASEGSVRIKAETNLELLGGNTGGGVLIESKSAGEFNFDSSGEQVKIGGLMLRAAQGSAVVEGGDVYIRSGATEDSIGNITLDAGVPYGSIYTLGRNVEHLMSGSFILSGGDFDLSESGEARSTVKVTPGTPDEPGSIVMATRIYNTGDLLNQGSATFGGNVIADGTYMTTTTSTQVVPLTKNGSDNPDQGDIVDKALAPCADRMKSDLESMTKSLERLTKDFYTDYRPGNPDVLEKSGFSFRTDTEYSDTDVYVYADRWQLLAGSTSGARWAETPVKTWDEKGSYPFPGDKYYAQETPCFVYQAPILYNELENRLENRFDGEVPSNVYQEPRYAEPEVKPLSEYTII